MNAARIRLRAMAVAVSVCAVLVVSGLASPPGADQTDGSPVSVVVQGADALSAVEVVGGTVVARLPLVDGVVAEVTPDQRHALARTGQRLTPDLPITLTSAEFTAADTDVHLQALNPAKSWNPEAGAGVGVALIDTGVALASDLAGRVVHGPDLSGEGDGVDRYGHGTFMAGLVAGNGEQSATQSVRRSGVAPGAHLVSVKVAGRDGITSLSRILIALDWVVEHASTYDVRVLNLSFGVETPMAWPADPLSTAVEAAWASGITVVAAAGNDGADGLTSPGRAPSVITAGATDPNGTPSTADDTVPAWSSRDRIGPFTKPDLLAPGVSVVSLRTPGSTIDEANPSARIDDAYFRGAGTSMSAALTSGAAAVLLAGHPEASPDDIKRALVAAADPIEGSTAGALDLAGAEEVGSHPEWSPRRWRGGWSTSRWYESEWATSRWYTSRWYDAHWATSRWYTSRWYTSRWYTSRWYVTDWAASRWGLDGSDGAP